MRTPAKQSKNFSNQARPLELGVFDALSEAQQLTIAAHIVRSVSDPESAQALTHITHLAQVKIRDIESGLMVDAIPEGSSVDPEFFGVFLRFYNRIDQPTIAMSYRHAVMAVSSEHLACAVSSETVVRHALSKMRRAS